MRSILFYLIIAIGFIACTGTKQLGDNAKAEFEIATDSVEYDLVVFDPNFDIYLATQPYSKNFYSNSYYQQWNIRYCTEWNIRHSSPLRYGDFYETNIPYDAHVDYGLDFNFKLYHYFQFIEQEYNIVLISRRGKAVN